MSQIILSALIFLLACNDNKHATPQILVDSSKATPQLISENTTKVPKNYWVDRLNNKKYPLPDSIGDRPVSFYLDNPQVAFIAKSLYRGQFRPADNDSTTQLLSYVTTNDSTIRPFYRWCLDFIISISDGALGEYPGSPALKYAIKFPKEFFNFIGKDNSGQRYKQWIEIIAYSGLDDYNKKELEIEREIINNMQNNCYSCDNEIKSHIVTFAKDITKGIKLQD